MKIEIARQAKKDRVVSSSMTWGMRGRTGYTGGGVCAKNRMSALANHCNCVTVTLGAYEIKLLNID
jgi:hypothetical protein